MNYNLIFLAGNLTNDPELRYSSSNLPFAKSSLAVNSYSQNNKKTLFVNIVIFGKIAESFCKLAYKGTNVFVQGRLDISPYVASSGAKSINVSILVDQFQIVRSNRQNYENQYESKSSIEDEASALDQDFKKHLNFNNSQTYNKDLNEKSDNLDSNILQATEDADWD